MRMLIAIAPRLVAIPAGAQPPTLSEPELRATYCLGSEDVLGPRSAMACWIRISSNPSWRTWRTNSRHSKGISLHFVDMLGNVSGNGMGKLFFTMLSAFAEWERERIADRVAEGRDEAKSNGQFIGGKVPYGFRIEERQEGMKVVRYLVEDADQQAVIAQMKKLHRAGHSYREIGAQVGGPFANSPTMVMRTSDPKKKWKKKAKVDPVEAED